MRYLAPIKNLLVPVIFSAGIIALCLHLIRGRVDFDLSQIGPIISGLLVHPSIGLWVYILLIGVFFCIKAYRYYLLIGDRITIKNQKFVRPSHHTFTKLVLVTMARSPIVDSLPSRSGELLFLGLLKRYCSVRLSLGLSMVLIASALDLLATVLFAVFFLAVYFASAKTAIIILTTLLCLCLVGFAAWPSCYNYLCKLFKRKNQNRLILIVLELLEAVDRAVRVDCFAILMMLSVMAKAVKIFAIACLVIAVVGVGSETSLFNLPYALGVSGSIEISTALPIPTVLQFGTWEAGGLAYFLQNPIMGIDLEYLVIILLAVHFANIVFGMVLGGIALLVLPINSSIKRSKNRT